MIWIPCPVEQLPTHTSRFTVDASAVNLMKELFSILPQNSPVSPQSPKPKKPHDFDQELTVYEDEVFPQYPFKSHISTASAQVFPACGLFPQGGCCDKAINEKIEKKKVIISLIAFTI